MWVVIDERVFFLIKKICKQIKEYTITNKNDLIISFFLAPLFFIFFSLLLFTISYIDKKGVTATISSILVLMYIFSSLLIICINTITDTTKNIKEITRWFFPLFFIVMNLLVFFKFTKNSLPDDDWPVIVFIFDTYTWSYLILRFLKKMIIQLKNWIFTGNENQVVLNKLSLTNKLIVAFVSIISAVLGIILTLKQVIGK